MMPLEMDLYVLHERLTKVVLTPGLKQLVSMYFSLDTDNPFAGKDFDQLGDNPPDRFVADDLLALNLLDIRLHPIAIRRILSGEFDQLLSKLPSDKNVESLDSKIYTDADKLWSALHKLPDVGTTTTTKLMSRKRPKLIPIRDGIVSDVLGLGNAEWWSPLAFTLSPSSDLRHKFDELNPNLPDYSPSTLRLLDVSIWMLGSGSENAIVARKLASDIPRCTFPIS